MSQQIQPRRMNQPQSLLNLLTRLQSDLDVVTEVLVETKNANVELTTERAKILEENAKLREKARELEQEKAQLDRQGCILADMAKRFGAERDEEKKLRAAVAQEMDMFKSMWTEAANALAAAKKRKGRK